MNRLVWGSLTLTPINTNCIGAVVNLLNFQAMVWLEIIPSMLTLSTMSYLLYICRAVLEAVLNTGLQAFSEHITVPTATSLNVAEYKNKHKPKVFSKDKMLYCYVKQDF